MQSKRLVVSRGTLKDASSLMEIADTMEQFTPHVLNCAPWGGYVPQVEFRVMHTSDKLYLKFSVTEQYTAALVENDHGQVWTDSCVEFFIAFDDSGYYNFEFTCIGRALLAFRLEKPNPRRASNEVMASIERFSTLGHECFAERKGDNHWQLTVAIPYSAFFEHNITNLDGVSARANFYKCGDNLSKPHFVAWNQIENPTPNFHLMQYFGTLNFQ